MTKKENIILVILTTVMTFMEMSALPSAIFVNVNFADINPIYFALMVNFLIAFAVCFILKQTVIKNWNFGLNHNGIVNGLKKYSLPAILATIAVTVSFCIGFMPFDNKPTVWRVVIEGIVYYVGVAAMEELYLRGLLQNIIEKWLYKKKNPTLYAIIITSVLFGLGHIFGAIGQPVITIIFKAVWATGLGIYFGSVYAVTGNLWVAIILHFFIDLCGIPVCFSLDTAYPTVALFTSLISFSLLGLYGILILKKQKN